MNIYDDIRASAESIRLAANQAEATDQSPLPPPQFSPVNCLAGTNAASRGGLNVAHEFFQIKNNEFERLNFTFQPGGVVLLGCSFTNYIASSYVHPQCINLGTFGTGLRHQLQQLTRPGIQAILERAGVVVIYGLMANTIGQEMSAPTNCTEAQMLANVDYMLEGLAGWFTGRGIFVAGTPQIVAHQSPFVTNERNATCNGYIQNHFGSKPGWSVVDVNDTLAPIGELLTQYSELDGFGVPVMGGHLNSDGIDVVFNAVRSRLATM